MEMGTGVKNIKAADLEPGMMTAMDVVTPTGRVLLPAGSKLTARHIRMLNARGVDHIAIACANAERPSAPSSPVADAEEVNRRIRQRFQHNDSSHPFISELVRLCESRMLDRE